MHCRNADGLHVASRIARMNNTVFFPSMSVAGTVDALQYGVREFATVWVNSLELRIAVFVLVLQCCIMVWATSLVREITCTATTVLCRLLVYDSAASAAPCIRTKGTSAQAYAHGTRHKTDGGPPPFPPPEVDVQAS